MRIKKQSKHRTPIKLKPLSEDVVERNVRLQLEFKIDAYEITEQSVRVFFHNKQELLSEPQTWRNAEHQWNFMKAVLKNDSLLRKFVIWLLMSQISPDSYEELLMLFGIDDEKKMFMGIVEELPEESRAYFTEAIKAGTFWESIELVFDAFIVDWASGNIEEVKEIGKLRIDIAEV